MTLNSPHHGLIWPHFSSVLTSEGSERVPAPCGVTQLRLGTKTPKTDGPSQQEALEGIVGLLPEILASCML